VLLSSGDSYQTCLLVGIDKLYIESLLVEDKGDLLIVECFAGLGFYQYSQSLGTEIGYFIIELRAFEAEMMQAAAALGEGVHG
jgi:hypothetical protein